MADTQAYRSGKITGTNKSASMTSLPRVAAVMVESMVPMPAMPMLPTTSGTTSSQPVSAGAAKLEKNTQYSGTAITSTNAKNTKFDVALARKITPRSSGARSSPSKQPFSVSLENERFRPRSDVNTTSAHRRPPDTSRNSEPGRAKESATPNTTMTRKA